VSSRRNALLVLLCLNSHSSCSEEELRVKVNSCPNWQTLPFDVRWDYVTFRKGAVNRGAEAAAERLGGGGALNFRSCSLSDRPLLQSIMFSQRVCFTARRFPSFHRSHFRVFSQQNGTPMDKPGGKVTKKDQLLQAKKKVRRLPKGADFLMISAGELDLPA